MKDNVPLPLNDSRYEIINQDFTYQLIIPNVTEDDSGEYTIKAGEVQSTANLIINGQFENRKLCYVH